MRGYILEGPAVNSAVAVDSLSKRGRAWNEYLSPSHGAARWLLTLHALDERQPNLDGRRWIRRPLPSLDDDSRLRDTAAAVLDNEVVRPPKAKCPRRKIALTRD